MKRGSEEMKKVRNLETPPCLSSYLLSFLGQKGGNANEVNEKACQGLSAIYLAVV